MRTPHPGSFLLVARRHAGGAGAGGPAGLARLPRPLPPRSPSWPVATPGALAALERAHQAPGEFLGRHVAGDWGEVPQEDKTENEVSLLNGYRILCAYRTSLGERLWILTEADRSVTTILLPEDY
jgi:hypothetical protein